MQAEKTEGEPGACIQNIAPQDAVLILSSSWICRGGLKHLIFEHGAYGSVLEAEDIESALGLLASMSNIKIVITDLQAADGDTGEHICNLLAAAGDVPVIVMSDDSSLGSALAAIDLGVSGYTSRDAGEDDILRTINAVKQGSIHVSKTILRKERPDPVKKLKLVSPVSEGEMGANLTPRQTEILAELGRGKSNRDIAERLQISVQTVKIHVAAILKTLRVENRTQAALLVQFGTPI